MPVWVHFSKRVYSFLTQKAGQIAVWIHLSKKAVSSLTAFSYTFEKAGGGGGAFRSLFKKTFRIYLNYPPFTPCCIPLPCSPLPCSTLPLPKTSPRRLKPPVDCSARRRKPPVDSTVAPADPSLSRGNTSCQILHLW